MLSVRDLIEAVRVAAIAMLQRVSMVRECEVEVEVEVVLAQ